ncbi:hypothetical protein PR048_016214 [Dryococelus australis]|uniref:Uncharacterized protein n=1 Tax=Dryococelus australis TaxID=614101 RepID=A0ABQ9HJ43_9NEOP|nr:hypothetical protein PR048_016214 [Dryococelus australis]
MKQDLAVTVNEGLEEERQIRQDVCEEDKDDQEITSDEQANSHEGHVGYDVLVRRPVRQHQPKLDSPSAEAQMEKKTMQEELEAFQKDEALRWIKSPTLEAEIPQRPEENRITGEHLRPEIKWPRLEQMTPQNFDWIEADSIQCIALQASCKKQEYIKAGFRGVIYLDASKAQRVISSHTKQGTHVNRSAIAFSSAAKLQPNVLRKFISNSRRQKKEVIEAPRKKIVSDMSENALAIYFRSICVTRCGDSVFVRCLCSKCLFKLSTIRPHMLCSAEKRCNANVQRFPVSIETNLSTNSQCDKQTYRRHRGAHPQPSDYRAATLPPNYGLAKKASCRIAIVRPRNSKPKRIRRLFVFCIYGLHSVIHYGLPFRIYTHLLDCGRAVLSGVSRHADLRTGCLQCHVRKVAYPPLHIATAISRLTTDDRLLVPGLNMLHCSRQGGCEATSVDEWTPHGQQLHHLSQKIQYIMTAVYSKSWSPILNSVLIVILSPLKKLPQAGESVDLSAIAAGGSLLLYDCSRWHSTTLRLRLVAAYLSVVAVGSSLLLCGCGRWQSTSLRLRWLAVYFSAIAADGTLLLCDCVWWQPTSLRFGSSIRNHEAQASHLQLCASQHAAALQTMHRMRRKQFLSSYCANARCWIQGDRPEGYKVSEHPVGALIAFGWEELLLLKGRGLVEKPACNGCKAGHDSLGYQVSMPGDSVVTGDSYAQDSADFGIHISLWYHWVILLRVSKRGLNVMFPMPSFRVKRGLLAMNESRLGTCTEDEKSVQFLFKQSVYVPLLYSSTDPLAFLRAAPPANNTSRAYDIIEMNSDSKVPFGIAVAGSLGETKGKGKTVGKTKGGEDSGWKRGEVRAVGEKWGKAGVGKLAMTGVLENGERVDENSGRLKVKRGTTGVEKERDWRGKGERQGRKRGTTGAVKGYDRGGKEGLKRVDDRGKKGQHRGKKGRLTGGRVTGMARGSQCEKEVCEGGKVIAEIWEARNIKVLRADYSKVPEKTFRPRASSGTIIPLAKIQSEQAGDSTQFPLVGSEHYNPEPWCPLRGGRSTWGVKRAKESKIVKEEGGLTGRETDGEQLAGKLGEGEDGGSDNMWKKANMGKRTNMRRKEPKWRKRVSMGKKANMRERIDMGKKEPTWWKEAPTCGKRANTGEKRANIGDKRANNRERGKHWKRADRGRWADGGGRQMGWSADGGRRSDERLRAGGVRRLMGKEG